MTTETPDDVAAMLRDSARDFSAREQDLRAYRARMGRAPGYDAERFGKMHELGWRSALVREEFGGAGMGLREVAAVAEELGRVLLGEVFLATSVLPVRLLQDRDSRPPAALLLQAVAEGSTVLALAWQEQANGLAADAIELQASRKGAGYVLTGAKHWIAGGQAANSLLVTARLEGGIAVFHLPHDTQGVTMETRWQVDGTASMSVRLHDVQLRGDALVVAPAQGALAVTRALDACAVVAGAELLGVMNAAFDMTIAYMKTRVQYDKPIGSFQALQHKAVDLLVQRELAASVLEEALAAFDKGAASDAARSRIASRCKARCSDAALRITRECIQLHGAIGYTHEYDLGLYVKRALVLAAWLGNSGQHRRRSAGA
jgi:alkylation response protein AidB-like acyl-CoA dehydrogenase